MSRFSKNLPSVRQYQQSAPPPAFDRDGALRVLRDGVSLINSFYPAGALEWLRENRPDVTKQLRADFAAINKAIADEDRAALTAAVEVCIKHHRRAFEIFEARPPAIEVQGDLLAAA